ncbi:hypothetical protein [Sanguibacter antarcticus]|uniref:Heparinase II/III-like protein n=1 Tax=Sanguibacter antarcticus TaxID=372484 RepID=A0A2A9E117_9MICO|nr:hypothetical protein [Sanguibacter antarcticus]PFG32271.1 hypothetical protein ATL42_0090 [Sanguibacter antarcticus]
MNSEELRGYVSAYRDFSPHGWKGGPDEAGSGFVVTLPNGYSFLIDASYFPVDWWKVYEYNHVTTRLWQRSLCYLPLLADHIDGWQIIQSMLRDFSALMTRAVDEPSILGMNSLDHSVALQLRSLCTLRAQLASFDTPDAIWVEEMDYLLKGLVCRLENLARSEGFRLVNNHGVMLGLALMHSRAVFSDIERSNQMVEEDDCWMMTALDEIVDSDGLVFENTPQYQRLYIDVIEQIVQVSGDLLGELDRVDAYDGRLKRVVSGYRHLLTADGTVPAIGDAQRTKDKKYQYLPGIFCSPLNGLYIRNAQRAQLVVTSGCRSHVHKQMDDTAIRLIVDDIDMLLDGGLINYDSHDAAAVAVRAQPGHSGLFFSRFDDRPCHWFYPAGMSARIEASIGRVTDPSGREVVSCRYVLEEMYEARREVAVRSAVDFVVTDRCWAPEPASQRFVLPPASCIEVSGQVVTVRSPIGPVLRIEALEGNKTVQWGITRVKVGLERTPVETWSLQRPVPPGGGPVVSRVSVFEPDGRALFEGGH